MDSKEELYDSWEFFDTQPGPDRDVGLLNTSDNVPQSVSKPSVGQLNISDNLSQSVSKPPVHPHRAKVTVSKGEKSRSPSPSDSGSSRSRSSSKEYSSCSDSATDSKKSPRHGIKNTRVKPRDSARSRSHSGSESGSSRSTSSSFSHIRTKSKSVSKRDDSGPESDNNTVAKANNHRFPQRGRSQLGDNEDSSSAYSDGEEEEEMLNKNNSYSRKRQAWGDNIRVHSDSVQVRPKTAMAKSALAAQRNKSRLQSNTLSESDMTDVSPIESPRNNKQNAKRNEAQRSSASDKESVKMQFRAMSVSERDLRSRSNKDENYDQQTSGLELEILMKAVGELEKQKRLQANSRHVMFAPMTLKKSEKTNYTYDKKQTRDIERENQRLLKEIVMRVNKSDGKKRFNAQAPDYKLTASAINREREMKRIESDNMAFLKRLQKVKPTNTISREHQLRTFDSTTLHGVPMAALHPMPHRGRSIVFEDSTSSIESRTRSMTSIQSAASTVRSVSSSRRSSRPSSATKCIDTRPQWSDRW